MTFLQDILFSGSTLKTFVGRQAFVAKNVEASTRRSDVMSMRMCR